MTKKKKRTSVICNDRIAYTDEMDDATAGKFFKMILALRNGRDEQIPLELKFIMAHIQSFWREVDEEYEKKSQLQREKANKRRKKSDSATGGPSADITNDATAYHGIPLNADDADGCHECLTDTITKDSIYKNIYRVRKEKNIVNHKNLSKEIKNSIDKILQELSEEEVITAIENYATIYYSEKTFFDYKWTLPEFLSRKNGARVFLYKSESDYLDNKKAEKQKPNQEKYSSEARNLET